MQTSCYLFLCTFILSSSAIAQTNSNTHLDLGFSAKMNHLTALNVVTKVDEEPKVKKSSRTLSEILASSKKSEDLSKYHLIAGCFSSLLNAETLVNKLIADSYSASVVGVEDDLYFVAFKTFKVYKDAIDSLVEFKAQGLDSWVKRM